MGGTASKAGNLPISRSAPAGATPAQPRPANQRKQERRRALIISCGMLLLATLTAAMVVVVEYPVSGHSSNSPQIGMAMPDSDVRTAKITRDPDGKGCWQQSFDNQSGRMSRSQQPCEATAFDSNGNPVPVGTIHRLDAISKSFSGR